MPRAVMVDFQPDTVNSVRPQQRIQGGLRGLKTPLGLRPPVSVANVTVKEHEGETGTSANRLLFRSVAEFCNFGHTIKSHDHQTTCSAVFEMTTDSWGSPKNLLKIFFSGIVMAINANF